MSQEAVPEQAGHEQVASPPNGAPKGLLQQMEELMAALNADLSRLDADLQSSGDRPPSGGITLDRSYEADRPRSC